MKRGAAVLLLLATATSGCSGCDRDRKETVASSSLPPLAAPSAVQALEVPGFGEAVVDVPLGATTAVPVVVAVLGIGDTPESQCATWRELLGARAFVLCPRGQPHWVREEPARVEASPASSDAGEAGEPRREAPPPEAPAGAGPESPPPAASSSSSSTTVAAASNAPQATVKQVGFFPPDGAQLEREVDAGLAALRARYGAYVATRGEVYAGFSRGAFLGASLVAKRPSRFRRVVLVEGGQTPWTDASASSFAAGGGERVLFACGQPSCVDEANAAAAILGRRNVATRVVHGQNEGHGYKRQVKEEIRRSLDWLTEGDAAWRQPFADRATYK